MSLKKMMKKTPTVLKKEQEKMMSDVFYVNISIEIIKYDFLLKINNENKRNESAVTSLLLIISRLICTVVRFPYILL